MSSGERSVAFSPTLGVTARPEDASRTTVVSASPAMVRLRRVFLVAVFRWPPTTQQTYSGDSNDFDLLLEVAFRGDTPVGKVS
ncbi:MAG: hypothetical protein ACXVHQ_37145 [Solirubrobacteraceae bacterium]